MLHNINTLLQNDAKTICKKEQHEMIASKSKICYKIHTFLKLFLFQGFSILHIGDVISTG